MMAVVLILLGTYHHFKIFWDEYRQSTWQESLKIFAPGIILAMIFVYLFFAIASFYMGGKSSASPPPMELPSAETATNPLTAAINTSLGAVNSVANSMNTAATSAVNAVKNVLPTSFTGANTSANKKNNGAAPTRSFLATI
jgi:phage-related protein